MEIIGDDKNDKNNHKKKSDNVALFLCHRIHLTFGDITTIAITI